MAKQVLYIVTGLPYSGKTILTKELVRKLGVSVASVDDFLDKYIVKNMAQKDWDKVYSQAFEKLEKLLNGGKSVVFDGASLKRSERDTLRAIANKCGVESKLIYVKTDIAEIKRRQLKNIREKTRGHLEDALLNNAIRMFEEPNEEEGAIVYEYPEDLKEWVKNCY